MLTNYFTSFSIILPPLFWLIGLHAPDISKILLVLMGLSVCFPKGRKLLTNDFTFTKYHKKFFIFYLSLFPILITLQHIVRIYNGSHGTDFVFFTEPVERFAQNQGLTIRMNMQYASSYFYHHFSPVLYLPALLVLLHIPAPIALIIFGFLSITLTFYFLYKLLLHLNFDKTLALFLLLCISANFNLRHSLQWCIRTETFAYPFIISAMLQWLKKNHFWAIISILLTFLAQENYFIYGLFFCIMVFVDIGLSWGINKNKSGRSDYRKRDLFAYILLFLTSLIGIYIYLLYKDIFFKPSINKSVYENPTSMLIHPSQLLKGTFYSDRLVWGYFFFLPFLFLPLLYPQSWFYCIPALGGIALSLFSNLKQMLGTFDHYANYPSLLIYMGVLSAFSMYKPNRESKISKLKYNNRLTYFKRVFIWFLEKIKFFQLEYKNRKEYLSLKKSPPLFALLLLITIPFLYSGTKSSAILFKFFFGGKAEQKLDLSPLMELPQNSQILVHKESAGFFSLLPNRFHLFDTIGLEIASQGFYETTKNFNYIVLRNKEDLSELPDYLSNQVYLCKDNSVIFVYCRK